jgi:hypothetical protein
METKPSEVGWMPAIIAVLLLLLMGSFIACGVGTLFLFRQAPRMAAQTLRGSYIPLVEQANLDAQVKRDILGQLQTVVRRMESGELTAQQSSALMEQLIVRTPIVQWGDLEGLIAMVEKRDTFPVEDREKLRSTVFRLQRAIDLNRMVADQVEDVLSSVTVRDDSARGCHLNLAASDEALREVVIVGENFLKQTQIPATSLEGNGPVDLPDLVRRRLESPSVSKRGS